MSCLKQFNPKTINGDIHKMLSTPEGEHVLAYLERLVLQSAAPLEQPAVWIHQGQRQMVLHLMAMADSHVNENTITGNAGEILKLRVNPDATIENQILNNPNNEDKNDA